MGTTRVGPVSTFLCGAALLALGACSGDTGVQTTSCGVPGIIQSCSCGSGSGTQTCQISGAWDVCACSAGGGDGGTGTNTGNAGHGGKGDTTGGGAGKDQVSLDGGGFDANVIDTRDAGDAASDDAATDRPKLYSTCTKDGDCGGDNRTCYKNVFSGFPGGGGNTSNTGYCTKPCTTANDCPAPAEPATALPACSSQGKCVLVCASGQLCPEALTCQGGICY